MSSFVNPLADFAVQWKSLSKTIQDPACSAMGRTLDQLIDIANRELMPTTMPALVAFHAVFHELPGCLGTARRFCELYDTWLAQGTEFCAACRTQHHLKTCSKCKAFALNHLRPATTQPATSSPPSAPPSHKRPRLYHDACVGSDTPLGRPDSPLIHRSSLLLSTPEREAMSREMDEMLREGPRSSASAAANIHIRQREHPPDTLRPTQALDEKIAIKTRSFKNNNTFFSTTPLFE
ncbi:hypothetical protein R3P38DRAFT_3114257 [Favolaschia claudopus]|uniref:Uncharacterized protein n=1 Tax=Favolaschia claudopus TaxID=2862362 RepID=A0AAV9ZGI6_9AGAR